LVFNEKKQKKKQTNKKTGDINLIFKNNNLKITIKRYKLIKKISFVRKITRRKYLKNYRYSRYFLPKCVFFSHNSSILQLRHHPS